MLGSSSDEQGDMSSSTDMLPDLVGELTNSGSAGTYGILSTGSDDNQAAEADADGPASTSSGDPAGTSAPHSHHASHAAPPPTADASPAANGAPPSSSSSSSSSSPAAASASSAGNPEESNSGAADAHEAPPYPATCRATRVTAYNHDVSLAAQLQSEVPVTAPGHGQLLVRVSAAAVNPIDWKMSQGYLPAVVVKPPFSMGFDFCGMVVAAQNTRRLKVGQRVFGMCLFTQTGSFAEYLLVDEKYAALAPANLTDLEAASLPLAGLTSLQALRAAKVAQAHPRHQPRVEGTAAGPKVLVLGGASGTGVMGLQLAKALGASHVATTCSAGKTELCQGLGADRVVDYRTEDWTEVLRGEAFDAIYDCVGGEGSWHAASNAERRLLKPDGWFVTIAGDKQAPMTVSNALGTGLNILGRKFMSLFPNHPNYSFFSCSSNSDDLEELARMAEAQSVRPVIDRVFPLSSIIEALQYSVAGHATGKICIDCAGPTTAPATSNSAPAASSH